jgi:hypothetical protein
LPVEITAAMLRRQQAETIVKVKTLAGRNCSRDASPSTSRNHRIGTRTNNEKRSNFSYG